MDVMPQQQSHSYGAKQLAWSVVVLFVLAGLVIILLPSSQGALSPEDKARILKEIGTIPVTRLSVEARLVALEALTQKEKDDIIAPSTEERISVLQALE